MENIKFIVYGLNGNSYLLDFPVSFNLDISYYIPADAFNGKFYCPYCLEELMLLKIYFGEKTIFDGIIDEQSFSVGSSGPILEISARSRTALLLDNEAVPAAYNRPSLLEIFTKHGKPYGLTGITKNLHSTFEYNVTKGMSEWAAIYNFCQMSDNIIPRITSDLKLDVSPLTPKTLYSVSNDTHSGFSFSTLKLNIDRYNVVSSVLCKLSHTSGYTEIKNNDSAADRAIRRRRMLNLADTVPELYDYKTNSILYSSNSYYGTVTIPSPHVSFEIGDVLSVTDNHTNVSALILITDINYTLNSTGFSAVCGGSITDGKYTYVR